MSVRSNLVAYLTSAGLSTRRANANLDVLEAESRAALEEENARLRNGQQAVRDLHERRDGDSGTSYCDVCADHGDITWPCATIRALDEQTERTLDERLETGIQEAREGRTSDRGDFTQHLNTDLEK